MEKWYLYANKSIVKGWLLSDVTGSSSFNEHYQVRQNAANGNRTNMGNLADSFEALPQQLKIDL